MSANGELKANAEREGPLLHGTTPGPWEAVCLGSEGYAIMGPPYEGRPGRRRVARCGDTDWEQDKANARLIASTPDLVAEVQRLRAALREVHGACWSNSHTTIQRITETALSGRTEA